MAHLNETAEPKHVRLTMRNKEGSGKKNIRDIFRVFQNEDPDDVPTYVARDLNKLPPVTFDHVDVTTLLKDIVLLKSDMKDLKQKWETAEQVSAEIRRELSSLREQNAASATPPAACVNMQRGVAVQHETAPVSDSTRPATQQQPDTLRVSDPAADRKGDNNMPPPSPPRPEPALHPDAAPFVPGKQKDVPPQKTRRPRRKRQPTPPVTLKGKQTTSTAANENNAASKAIVDEEGFILAESRKRQLRRNRNKRGTVSAASTILKAAEPLAELYVSRLDCNTTPEDIMQHVQKMCQLRQELPWTPGDSTVYIRRLESKIATNFRSFVLSGPRKVVCFYMFGNMKMLMSNSTIWRHVHDKLVAQNAIGKKLVVRCESHLDETFEVDNLEDLEDGLIGFCLRVCEKRNE
ncbi:hypothetical protein NE865_01551 [Phthorimaea operculella]|nr:hypothetical protein NE865_01551 [Phthorimaea operculella]